MSRLTEFCSCYPTYFQSPSPAIQRHFQSVNFTCQSMYCQSVTCCCRSTYFRSVIQIYSSFYSYTTRKHQETEAKLDNQRQTKKKKADAPSDEKNTNQKKGSVPQRRQKRRQNNTIKEWKRDDK